MRLGKSQENLYPEKVSIEVNLRSWRYVKFTFFLNKAGHENEAKICLHPIKM